MNIDRMVPFYGIVEGLLDPEECGRVQVRCFGYHTDDISKIPSNKLHWFKVSVNNSAGVSGKGYTPNGYLQGSMVHGYFFNDEYQDGFIVGSFTTIPLEKPNPKKGFNDPDGEYPSYINKPDYNKLGRGEEDHEMVDIRKGNAKKGVSSGSDTWNEPEYSIGEYPTASVFESRSGHVFEVDDTEGNEKIGRFHKTGSYDEFNKDGDYCLVAVGKGYQIYGDGSNLLVEGTCNLTVNGNTNAMYNGNKTETISGTWDVTCAQITFTGTLNVSIDVIAQNHVSLVMHTHTGNLSYPTSPPV